jgi:hypothetical protein
MAVDPMPGWSPLSWLAGLSGLSALGAGVAAAWARSRDRAHDADVWRALQAAREAGPARWDPSMAGGLPPVAQRYLRRAIAPGTPLRRVVRLEMEGEFTLGGRRLPLRARQILAPPARGFVWQAEIGAGVMRVVGSDGLLRHPDGRCDSWTRFWLHGLVPLARVGANPDHCRAAATRAMLESVWVPASLLPQHGARWEPTGPDSAVVRFADVTGIEPLHLHLRDDGTLATVHALRWSDANPDKAYRLQPFGGTVLESAAIDGFTLPVRVEMGNHFGTADYAPFFQARITAAAFE